MTDRSPLRWTRHALLIALVITALNVVAGVVIVMRQREAAQQRTAVAHARAMLRHGRD